MMLHIMTNTVWPVMSMCRVQTLQSALFTLATMLAALTIGYSASAFGQTVNLQEMRSRVLFACN